MMIKIDEKYNLEAFSILIKYKHSGFKGNFYRLDERDKEVLTKLKEKNIPYTIVKAMPR